jgi:hypothetical protein
MFKSYAIEYGSYVIIGLLISVIQSYADVPISTALGFIGFGMIYAGVIIPVIHYLAWGKNVL